MSNIDKVAFPHMSYSGVDFLGLTKLEYFTAAALTGILAQSKLYSDYAEIAEHAVWAAELAIKRLEENR